MDIEIIEDFLQFIKINNNDIDNENNNEIINISNEINNNLHKSIIFNSVSKLILVLDPFILTNKHPLIHNYDIKLLLQNIFHHNYILSLFNTNSYSNNTLFYKFTNCIYQLVVNDYNNELNILLFTDNNNNNNNNNNKCIIFVKDLINNLLNQMDCNNSNNSNNNNNNKDKITDIKLNIPLLENPDIFTLLILLYWSIGYVDEVNMLLIQYCVAIISQYCPTNSVTIDTDIIEEKKRNILFIQIIQNFQLLLSIGRLVKVKLNKNNLENNNLENDNFIRYVIPNKCNLDPTIIMLIAITIRILLTFSCLHYRYDAIKAILECNLMAPDNIQVDTINLNSTNSPVKLVDSVGYSPGMIALSKYWGLDTLLPLLSTHSLPPPPPAPTPTTSNKRKDIRSISKDIILTPQKHIDDDEASIQQHIMAIQMHILQHENKLSEEDAAYQYFADISRDDSLEFLLNKPAGTFLLRPHDSNSTNAIYLSFRSVHNASNGDIGVEIKTSHAVIRREKAIIPEQSITGYVYRCGSVGPTTSLIMLLTQISDLLTPSKLLFQEKLNNEKNNSNINDLKKNNNISNKLSAYDYNYIDPNGLLWCHIEPEEKCPKQSNTLWFVGTCLPSSEFLNSNITSNNNINNNNNNNNNMKCDILNKFPRKPFKLIAHIIQSILHLLSIKTLYRQLISYLNLVFNENWNWSHSSIKYLSHVICVLMSDDFSYYYSNGSIILSKTSISNAKGFDIRLDMLSTVNDINNTLLTESDMRRYYTTFFMPLLIYTNITKEHVLLQLTSNADNFKKNLILKNNNNSYNSYNSFNSLNSYDENIVKNELNILTHRNFLTNHILNKNNTDYTDWNIKLSLLTELELGECLINLIYESCNKKPIKIIYSTAPYRINDHSLQAPCVLIHDACAWLTNHMHNDLKSSISSPSYKSKDSIESNPLPTTICCLIVSYCEKCALLANSKKPHTTNNTTNSNKIVRPKSSNNKDNKDEIDEYVELCTPMMIINWLECMSIINIVIKPGDAFVASQKFIRYIEPWTIEPIYDLQKEKNYNKSYTYEKTTLGRSSYIPLRTLFNTSLDNHDDNDMLVSPDIQIHKELKHKKKWQPFHIKSNHTIEEHQNNRISSTNRQLQVVELILSAYVHRLVDSIDGAYEINNNIGYNSDEEDEEEKIDNQFIEKYYHLEFDNSILLNSNTENNNNHISFDSAADIDSLYTSESRQCYCYSYLNLWYGVNGEDWLINCIDNLTIYHSNLMSNTQFNNDLLQLNNFNKKENNNNNENNNENKNYLLNEFLLNNPLLQAPISPYHLSISNKLYRNSLFYEMCMSYRYVATLQIDLKSLKDISIRNKDINNQFGFNNHSTFPKDIEIYAIIKFLPATRTEIKAIQPISTSYNSTSISPNLINNNINSISPSILSQNNNNNNIHNTMHNIGSNIVAGVNMIRPIPTRTINNLVTRANSISPSASLQDLAAAVTATTTALNNPLCHIEPKQMLDTYVTPIIKANLNQPTLEINLHNNNFLNFNNYLHNTNKINIQDMSPEYLWNEQVAFKFPLPQQTYHINSLNPNHLTTTNNELHKDNYLNNLYEAPAVLNVTIYQKSFSIADAFTTHTNHDNKLGEVEIPLDNISDRALSATTSDWYPLSNHITSSKNTIKNSSSTPITTSSGIWLLYLQLQLSYNLMLGVE